MLGYSNNRAWFSFPENYMNAVRRSSERGRTNHGWLQSFHAFSFAGYFDSQFAGFGALRVINEDRVNAGAGFGTHGHHNMEIISYVLAGELTHTDSIGNASTIRPGAVQRMSAGSGIEHSEYNPSKTEPLHFLQLFSPFENNSTPKGDGLRVAANGPCAR